MYCDYQPNELIVWRDFIKRFELTDDERRVISRIQPKLQHVSDLLHFYMVSPKDAYRQVPPPLHSGTTNAPDT
jgi:hypothetical protein